MKKFLFGSVALVLTGSLFWLVQNSRASTETAAYRVVRAEGAFELRDYPALQTATTSMSDGGGDDGFGKLFRYITGANQNGAKIAMTTPVLIDRTPKQPTMSFILPNDVQAHGAPSPKDSGVRLGNLEAARFAVLRFKGGRSPENEKVALAKLLDLLRQQKMVARGEPMFAYYDPPWTPTFLRRNEVLLRVHEDGN